MHAGFPLPDPNWEPTRPFWEGAARGALLLPHCEGCARIGWYPDRCLDCGSGDYLWREVAGTGRLFTWVVVRHAFLPQFRGEVPFTSALVSMDVDPRVRLPTRIVQADVDSLAIDQPLEVCFRELRFEGVKGAIRAPFFRPV